ncbi:hypothetical protein Tco_0953597 [Tanacetum coccineum]|uniref:Uncharacterized protein n=1 Tax=Tanacetum coccineum TaxID=301880 RepID=A0ABQ5E2N1_9ASTR
MVNQEQNPPQQEQPFVAANQVSLNLEDILLNTNNEVALLYPEHNNKDYFKCVTYFISKSCLRKPFTRSPNMYKEYLAEFWYSATALENSKVSFLIPTGGIYEEVRLDSGFPLLDMGKKFPPKELSGRASFLLGGGVPQGTKPRAKPGNKKLLTSSKQPFVSSKVETKGGSSKAPTSSKTGHSKKRKKSISAMDSNPSHSSVSTPVDTGISGMSIFHLNKPIYSASFIIHSESALGNDASTVSTAETNPRISAPRTSNAAKTSEEIKFGAIKLEDMAKLVPNVKVDFKDLDSPEDDLIIMVDDSEEDEEEDKNEEIHSTTNDETEDISASTPPSPRSIQLQELKNQGQLNMLLVKSLTADFSKILSAHDFSSSLLTELKDLPSKFNELTEEVKVLKQQVHKLELELPGDLKDIPSKLEDFTKSVTSLTSQITELKNLQWELPVEFLSLPVRIASVQAKLKTIDALPGLLLNVTKSLNKFAQVFDSASSKAGDQGVPSAGQADTMPAEGEKNTNQATIS